MNRTFQNNYNALFKKIKKVIAHYQPENSAGRSFPIVGYWIIGSSISEALERLEKTEQSPEKLLHRLAAQFEPVHGYRFGRAGLSKMHQFYLAFPDWHSEFAELTWSHYSQLLRITDTDKRTYYLQEALTNQWSIRELTRQIKSHYYERRRQLDGSNGATGQLLQDPCILEFLDLSDADALLERELENALLEKLQLFLLELGKGFAFVARQKMITTTSGKRFYIDLVFYHFILKCFVLIDLKIGELTHGDIGQMDMYVRLYEEKWRQPGDQPTIGIILCPEKDETLVRYSILAESQQLFASRYQLYLPTKADLKRLDLTIDPTLWKQMKNTG